MKKIRIYVAHSKEIDYINELYEPLKNADFLIDYELLLPHELDRNSYNTRVFYKSIDIFIAEVSKPATGLGIELGWAYDDKTPLYCIHKSDAKPSNSIKSLEAPIFAYSDIEGLLDVVKQIIEHYKSMEE